MKIILLLIGCSLVLAIGFLVAFGLFFTRSRLGLAMRAVADDQQDRQCDHPTHCGEQHGRNMTCGKLAGDRIAAPEKRCQRQQYVSSSMHPVSAGLIPDVAGFAAPLTHQAAGTNCFAADNAVN